MRLIFKNRKSIRIADQEATAIAEAVKLFEEGKTEDLQVFRNASGRVVLMIRLSEITLGY